MGLRIIADDFKIIKTEPIYAVWCAMNQQLRQLSWFSCYLFTRLIKMIAIEMRITQNMDKFTNLQSTDPCDHMDQQCIGSDIERHPQKDIGASLIKLAGQTTIGDIKLKQTMTGRQGHLLSLIHI